MRIIAFIMISLSALAADPSPDPFAKPAATTPAAKRPVPPGFEVHLDPVGQPYFKAGDEHFYTKYLSAMQEPSLYKPAKNAPALQFRFTWLRSFHTSIAIRLWRDGDGCVMRINQLKEGATPGPQLIKQERKLSPEEWTAVKKLMDLPMLLKPLSQEEQDYALAGFDGAQWIFETRDADKYAMLDFWSLKDYAAQRYKAPETDAAKAHDTPALLRLALHLLKLSNLAIPESEIY